MLNSGKSKVTNAEQNPIWRERPPCKQKHK